MIGTPSEIYSKSLVPLQEGQFTVSIPKIGLQKIEINCNPNLVQNDNKT